MAGSPARRCEKHTLVVGPDGRCVVCRRDDSAVMSDAAQNDAGSAVGGLRVLLALGGLTVVACAVAAFWLATGTSSSAPIELAPARDTLDRPAPKPAASSLEEDRAKAEDLAESLRKLERAEQERLALERAQQGRDEEQRAEDEARRKREEAERDRKRHEDVLRDLQDQALGSARNKVTITMYSTTWCGVCTEARNYMQSKQIAFRELDVDHDAAAKAKARTLNPRGSVPTIAIDEEVLVGFSPKSLEDRISRAAKRRAGS